MADTETVEVETPAEEITTPTIEETAAAAYESAQARDAEAPEGEEGTEQPPASSATRTRGADGKFVQAKEGAETAAPARTKEPADNASEKVKPEETPASPIVAPPSMSAADKAEFAKLTPAMRAFVARRESQVEAGLQQKTQELAQRTRTYDQLDQVLTPRRQQFAMMGMSAAQAIDQLFTLSDFASRDPSGFIKYMADQRGVDLRSLVQNPEQQAAPVDPVLAATQKTVMDLQRTIQDITTNSTRSQEQQVLSEITSFKDAKDASGQPLHPHFDAVRQMMGALMQTNPGTDLQSVYDMAVHANPTTRALLAAERDAAVEKQRQDDAKARAARAKQAGGTVLTPRGTVPVKPVPKSMEETAREVYDRLNGAA